MIPILIDKNHFYCELSVCDVVLAMSRNQFSMIVYRHSLIYTVNVGTQRKSRGSKNRVNRGYLVVLKGRKIG